MENKKVLVRVRNLTKHFPIRKTSLFQREQLFVRANDDISLDIYEGETFGLVGESGCGKTTLGRVILQLYPQTSGTTLYYGKTLEEFKPKYVKHVINDLAKAVQEFDKHKVEYEGELLKADAENLLPAMLKVRERYVDVLRIAGGLVLADDLDEVSRVLTAEYDAGVKLFPLQLELEDVTMKRDTLAALDKATSQEKGQLSEFERQLQSLGPRREAAQGAYDERHAELVALRDKYSDREGFAELDAYQDEGIDLDKLTPEEQRVLRRELQVIFQDPYSSLNPRLTVGQLISEALTAHNIFKPGSPLMEKYVLNIMDRCGLQPYMLHRYPHQFSGGQRQRIGIARALSVQPKFVVCDEAVSALDVSIRSQIINLLIDLKEKNRLTYLFISHDLSVVKFISDRIGVMYLGSMVELATSDEMFADPLHPYTQVLLKAIPTTEDEAGKELAVIKGDMPSPINPPPGCTFHTRCEYVMDECRTTVPVWKEAKPGHFVACHLHK